MVQIDDRSGGMIHMAHDLTTYWIFILIHPPLAILGYLFTMISLKKSIQLTWGKRAVRSKKRKLIKDLRISLWIAWGLTLMGLITGMIWAYFAWGSPWSFDPKETATLLVFITLTGAFLLNLLRSRFVWQTVFLLVNLAIIIWTVSISFLSLGLHSY